MERLAPVVAERFGDGKAGVIHPAPVEVHALAIRRAHPHKLRNEVDHHGQKLLGCAQPDGLRFQSLHQLRLLLCNLALFGDSVLRQPVLAAAVHLRQHRRQNADGTEVHHCKHVGRV